MNDGGTVETPDGCDSAQGGARNGFGERGKRVVEDPGSRGDEVVNCGRTRTRCTGREGWDSCE